jgi:hypothetical protein
MMDQQVYDKPSDVDADSGDVIVKGPDAVDVRLTPKAAEETSDRLLEASLKARGQLYFEDDTRDQ